MRIDVSDRTGLRAAVERVLAAGPIDILINNSGGPPPGPIRSVEAAQWDAQFMAMAANLFEATRLVLPAMIERRWGRVITIASSGVEQPIPCSRHLERHPVSHRRLVEDNSPTRWRPTGLRSTSSCPRRIHTRRVDELDIAAASRNNQTPEAVARASAASIPARRYGTPKEFASVVAFLSSAHASYVTGSRVRVDGGAIRSI